MDVLVNFSTSYCDERIGMIAPGASVARSQYSAQAAINFRRFSISVPLAYAASALSFS
jgi:hypothetical protein